MAATKASRLAGLVATTIEPTIKRAEAQKNPAEAMKLMGQAYQELHKVAIPQTQKMLAYSPHMKKALTHLKRAYAQCFDGYRYGAAKYGPAARKWLAKATTELILAHKDIEKKVPVHA